FSSRRRHTRSKRDWSSDVCSSDLEPERVRQSGRGERRGRDEQGLRGHDRQKGIQGRGEGDEGIDPRRGEGGGEHLECEVHTHLRSEERRVGKEWRDRGRGEHEKEE